MRCMEKPNMPYRDYTSVVVQVLTDLHPLGEVPKKEEQETSEDFSLRVGITLMETLGEILEDVFSDEIYCILFRGEMFGHLLTLRRLKSQAKEFLDVMEDIKVACDQVEIIIDIIDFCLINYHFYHPQDVKGIKLESSKGSIMHHKVYVINRLQDIPFFRAFYSLGG